MKTTRVDETKAALEKAEAALQEAKRKGLPGVAALNRAAEDARLEYEAAVQGQRMEAKNLAEDETVARLDRVRALKSDLEKRAPEIEATLAKIETAADSAYALAAELGELVNKATRRAEIGFVPALAALAELLEEALATKEAGARRNAFRDLREVFRTAPGQALREVETQVEQAIQQMRKAG